MKQVQGRVVFSHIHVDQNGFFWAGPVKLFRIEGCHVVAFDKDKKRSNRRGTSDVVVTAEEMIEALRKYASAEE